MSLPSPQATKGASAPRLRLRVTSTAETILRSGHPWLFSGSIRSQNREGVTGELGAVYDRRDRFLAIGLYDPDSPLRLRVLHAGKPIPLDAAWWQQRLDDSLQRREALRLDPATTGYRLIHGEGDRWPGLVLDRYSDTLVLKLYTSIWLPRLGEVVALIQERTSAARVVLRLSRNIQDKAAREFSFTDGQQLFGDPIMGDQEFLENGLRFQADVIKGQKTGFFLDQRENRRRVEPLSRGKEVLNAFSFSGGFSLYSARGGARSVTDLDISAHALEAGRVNFSINQTDVAVARCARETIQADAFAWLESNQPRRFDLVILDPPSLAKREEERAGAIQAYGKLAANGIRSLRRGGVLVAASCSAHVSNQEFFNAVCQAARQSGREFVELERTGHPIDHPATFEEAKYLKCIYLRG